MRDVAVFHPERQHAHKLAMALDKIGRLDSFISGTPLPPGYETLRPRHRRLAATLYMRRAASMLPNALARNQLIRASFRVFDWRVSRRVNRQLGVVVAYEQGALHTFRYAKTLGLTTVLDAAGMEARYANAVLPGNTNSATIDAKDAEVQLADIIIACSSIAADAYRQVWTEKKVVAIPLGVDIAKFHPIRDRRANEKLTVLFVGHFALHKGIDVLTDAIIELEELNVFVEFRLITSVRKELQELRKRLGGRAKIIHPMSQDELSVEMGRADLLVLPSRLDSFGQVVLEAMACGTPALVTDQVGAAEAITDGVDGWIVPAGNADALASRLAACAEDRDRLSDMRPKARAAAMAYSLEAYERRIAEAFSNVLERDERAECVGR